MIDRGIVVFVAARRGWMGLPVAAILAATVLLALAAPGARAADAGCGDAGWTEEIVSASGDESGLGGTGARGDDSGLGGSGARGDDSGIGGTGVFGTLSAVGSVCVNGQRIGFDENVEVVLEKGVAIGAANLAVGQTVWLVAHPAEAGLTTSKVWVLPDGVAGAAAHAWLESRIDASPDLAFLSIEGVVSSWPDGDRFELEGVLVDATASRELRGALDVAARVRVSGAISRDGLLRPERISVRVRPPERPSRPVDRAPRIERPPTQDRPTRPDSSVRPNRRDRVSPTP